MPKKIPFPPLSGRLGKVAEMAPHCRVMADIGTDHAKLPVMMTLTGKAGHAFAADLREGPLERAADTIRRFGAEHLVTLVRSDGLSDPRLRAADLIVVAGMGGDLIARILAGAGFIRKTRPTLLLQPQTKEARLRKWLLSAGFSIVEEGAAEDHDFVYAVMRAEYTGEVRHCGERFAVMGLLEGDPSPEAASYRRRRLQTLRHIRDGMQMSGKHSDEAAALTRLITEIEEEQP